MSESGVGVSRAVTRQNAGSVLNASAPDPFVEGGMNAPAGTDSAEVSVPLVSGT
jgi:hypothetical protein